MGSLSGSVKKMTSMSEDSTREIACRGTKVIIEAKVGLFLQSLVLEGGHLRHRGATLSG